MKFLEKKTVYGLSLLISHLLLSDSTYGSDNTRLFGDFFSSTPKTSQKPLQMSSQKSSSPVPLSSQNLQAASLQATHQHPSQLSQGIISEQEKPIDQQAGAFLKEFPKILKKMAELEKHIPTLIPAHRRNIANLRNDPKNGDWRVLMAWAVEKPDISKRIKKIVEDVEALKKKKEMEKGKILKTKPQSPTSHCGFNEISEKKTEEAPLRDMPKRLQSWFYKTCNPTRQSLDHFFQDYNHFNQWWSDLPHQLKESEKAELLHDLLKEETKEESDLTMILNHLDWLLVQSLLLKSQSLYEDLLPTFMDLKTSSSTLRNLKEEALREDAQLNKVLQNSNLYKQIEEHIAKTIGSAVEDYLKQTTDDQLKQKVWEAFQQAMKDALIEKLPPLQNSSKEKGDSVAAEEDEVKILQEDLRKMIIKVISETISGGLNQATGRIDDQLQSRYSQKIPSKKTASSDEPSLMIDVAPLMQRLSKFINPQDQTTSRSWLGGYWNSSGKSAISSTHIPVSIPLELEQQWKIPPYRLIERDRKRTFKVSKPSRGVRFLQTKLLEEMLWLKENRVHSQAQSLEKFLSEKSVHSLFDLPKAYTYVPGIRGAQLLPKILLFFEEYEGLIRSYGQNLKKIDKGDLGVYLNPKRPSITMCQNHKRPFFNVFPSLDPIELKTGWVSLEIISLFDRKFLNNEDEGSFRAELENNIFLLSMVDGFADESLQVNHIDITRLIRNAKTVLFFKEKCAAVMAETPLPLEKDNQQHILDLFEEKCQAAPGVSEAITRMLKRQETKPSCEDNKFEEDQALLVSFFTELFRETLTECFSKFGLTSDKLETLKKITSPLPQRLGNEQPNPLTPSTSQLPDAQEDSKVTLYIPVNLQSDPQRSSKKETSSTLSSQRRERDPQISSQHQQEKDSDLPPVIPLNFSGVGSLF